MEVEAIVFSSVSAAAEGDAKTLAAEILRFSRFDFIPPDIRTESLKCIREEADAGGIEYSNIGSMEGRLTSLFILLLREAGPGLSFLMVVMCAGEAS